MCSGQFMLNLQLRYSNASDTTFFLISIYLFTACLLVVHQHIIFIKDTKVFILFIS